MAPGAGMLPVGIIPVGNATLLCAASFEMELIASGWSIPYLLADSAGENKQYQLE